jgi:hypothetical protein
MMTSRSLICLLENQNGGKLQKIILSVIFHNMYMYVLQKYSKRKNSTWIGTLL